jgi:hypothetical protein
MKQHFILFFVFPLLLFGQKTELKKILQIPPQIHEASGMIYLNGFWLINDSGNPSILYHLNNDSTLDSIIVDAPNYDWEALAMDADSNLYIGDFGNNLNKRKNLQILKITDLTKDSITPEFIPISFADQKAFPPEKKDFDCESMIFIGEYIFLFSKNRSGSKETRYYSFHKDSSGLNLVPKGIIETNGWITDATYDPSKKRLYLLSDSAFYTVQNFTGTGNYSSQEFKIERTQKEGICLVPSKIGNNLYISDEAFNRIEPYRVYLPNYIYLVEFE